MDKEITDLVNKTCYEQYSQSMPKAVALIDRLVAKGESPNRIHRFLLKRYGSCEITHHLGCVADYFHALKK